MTTICPAFGFKSSKTYDRYMNTLARNAGINRNDLKSGKAFARVDAASKILGYIPLAGIGIGIWRLRNDGLEVDKKQKIVRSIVEISGAGILLLPVDVIAVAARRFSSFLSGED